MKRASDDVQRCAGLTRQDFHAAFLEPERPVIMTDLCEDWPARRKWNAEYLAQTYGDYPIRAYYHEDGVYTAWKRMRTSTTIGEVIRSTSPSLFASADLIPECPYLIDDIKIPHVIAPEWVADQSSVWIQPRGHRTGLHWDSFSSMISVLRGCKRVLIFQPDQYELLYPCPVTGSKDFSLGSWSRIDVFDPDYALFPDARRACYREVFVEAGETLLIPRHWWHAVENLGDPTIAVSFFVTPQGRPELTFYHDRRLIAGLSIKVGVLSGER